MSTTTDPAAVVSRVETLVQMGRPERALEEVDRALASVPDDARLLVASAWVRLRLQRSAEAVPLLEQAVAARPDAHGALHLLSIAQQNTGDVAAARDSAARALELDPDDARYHLQVADSHLAGTVRKADRVIARERIESALELAPEDPGRLLGAARLWSRLGDDDRARALVARGLAVAPEHTDLLYANASLAVDAGASTNALGGVLALNPEHAEAGYLLHLRVWQQLLRLVGMPVVLMGSAALVVTFLMNDSLVGGIAVFGWILVAWFVITAVRVLPVLARVPRGLLRRTLRETATGRATAPLIAVTWVGALAGVVLILLVRDAVLVRWFLVALAAAILVGAVTSTVAHRALLRQADELGYVTPDRSGLARVASVRTGFRAGATSRLVIVGLVLVVVAAIGPGGLARPDARGVALLAAVAWTLPLLIGVWSARSLEARLRADGATPVGTRRAAGARDVLGGVVLGLVTALLLVVGALAIVAVPVTPGAHDADGRYTPTVREPSDGSTCAGRPAGRLVCLQREREERMEELQERMDGIDIPTFDAPELELPDMDLPSVDVPDIDGGTG
ncbi:tetratricopeptide repeat protein [Cellulosimicrobium terreum]|nr:tetratricopeptide repeat protein [Cellulosimicrobium terreum]